jgi:prevent-host-death family protein
MLANRVTVAHMKTITIRELHARTGKLVREASRHGQILVTDKGMTIAKIMPVVEREQVPYFARRKFIEPGIRGSLCATHPCYA